MGVQTDAARHVRADLCDRIDRIARELPHMDRGTLAFAVDDVRRAARANGHDAVAELARGLEHAIADSGGATIVLPFLEAMSDAVGCDSVDPRVAQAFLASVELRIHG